MLKTNLIFCFFFVFTLSLQAQNSKVDSLKALLEIAEDDSTKATRMSMIGRELMYSQPQVAVKWLYKSLELGIRSKGTVATSNSLIALADYHYFISSDMDSSLYYTKESIRYNKKYADSEGLAVAYTSLARYYGETGRYLESIEEYEKALELYPEGEKMEFHRMGAVIGMGDAYFRYGAYDAALKYYNDYYKIPNALKYEEHHSITTNAIGQVYFKLKEYEKALKYTKQSLKLLEKQNNKLGVGIALFNIGEIMFATNKIDAAISYNDSSLNILKDYDYYPAGIADCKRLYGDIAMSKNDYEKAVQYYASVAEIFKEKDFTDRQTDAMILHGKALAALKRYKEAESRLQEALNILDKKTALQQLAECYKALRDNAKSQGKYQLAQQYTEQYEAAYENYLGQEKVVATINNEVKLRVQLKELTIAKQQVELERKNRNIIIIILIAMLSVISLVTIVFYLRNKAQKEKAAALAKIDDLNLIWQGEVEQERQSKEALLKKMTTKTVELSNTTLFLDKIYYIEADNNYTIFYGKNGQLHRANQKFGDIKKLLYKVSTKFRQVHRSYIVNRTHVEKTEKRNRKQWCVLLNDTKVPMTNNYDSLD